MAEFPDAGRHCALSLCNKFDYAPFTCRLCNQFYCGLHRLEHGCPTAETASEPPVSAEGPVKRQFICSAVDCEGREFVEMQCSHCNRNFCISHRQCEDHECPSVKQSAHKTSNRTANESVASSSVHSAPLATALKPKNPLTAEQMARVEKVAIMQLKLRNPLRISADQQLFLFAAVQPEEGLTEQPARTVVMVSKFWTLGKAVDVIAKQLALDDKRWTVLLKDDVVPFPSDDITKHFRDRDEIRLTVVKN